MEPAPIDDLAGWMIVWITRLSQARDSLPQLERYLDSEDRERAARFRLPDDRARFLLGRTLLRTCLGHYLSWAPETIALAYTDRGRPFLPPEETIQFSISHTHDLVALAVTRDARIGIDLEYTQVRGNPAELAGQIFSDEDLQAFLALPNEKAPAAFFRAWTRKEAYLKARGEGIAEALRQVSVSMSPDETGVVNDARDPDDSKRWRLHALPIPESYAGTLACDDRNRRFECNFVRLDQGRVVIDSPA